MMEKYGVSFDDLPPTEEQVQELLKLACELHIDYRAPHSRAEADMKIQRYTEMEMEKES